MKYIILLFISFEIFAASVGSVVVTEGKTFRKEIDTDKYLKLNKGDIVYQGDEIKTVADAKVKIVFEDDTEIFIAANSKIKIDNYKIDVNKNQRNSVLNLLEGKVKFFVTNKFNDNNFEIKSGNITLGVRGTIFIVSNISGEVEIDVLDGEIAVNSDLATFNEIYLTQNQYVVFKEGMKPVIENIDMNKLNQIDISANTEKEREKENEIKVTSIKFKDLSQKEIISKSADYINTMKNMMSKSYNILKEARKEKNIMKLNCINDNIMVIKGYLRRSEDDKLQIDEYLSQDNNSNAVDLLAKIYEAFNSVKQADISIQSCSGNVLTYTGKKEVNVEVEKFNVENIYLDKEYEATTFSFNDDSVFTDRQSNTEPLQISPYF